MTTTDQTADAPGTDVAVAPTYTASLLPANADSTQWTPQQHAMMAVAGLVKKQGNKYVAIPRPDAEAFLYQCRRTGLDPIARQIYLVERGGKYTIQISIDGALLIAERTGQYRGQTPAQWTDGTLVKTPMRDTDGSIVRDGDGSIVFTEEYRWFDVWLHPGQPVAARVGVYREGFEGPQYSVANFSAYDAGNNMWKKMGARMIAKCAEMLALRKTFPMELSGLYSTEEMQQAGGTMVASQPAAAAPATTAAPAVAAAAPSAPQEAPAGPAAQEGSGWADVAFSVAQLDGERGLRALFKRVKGEGLLAERLSAEQIAQAEKRDIKMGTATPAVGDLLMALSAMLPEIAEPVVTNPATGEVADEEIVEGELVPDSELQPGETAF